MLRRLFVHLCAMILSLSPLLAEENPEKDVIKTSAGDLEIVFLGHASLMMRFAGKTIDIDPYGHASEYATLPKADLILITHQHGDHLDLKALDQVRKEKAVVLLTAKCAGVVRGGVVIHNGESQTVLGIPIEAVPAYNIVQRRPDGAPFHPKGEGNGYVLTFGKTRVYVAGDTENIPEMADLQGIDIAFLPMNLPYTMTPEMVANAVKTFHPKVLYPYHYGETDTNKLLTLLKGNKDVEVRIRNMK